MYSHDAAILLADLSARGITLTTNGVELSLVADPGVISSELRQRIIESRQAVIAHLLSRGVSEHRDSAVPRVPHVVQPDSIFTPSEIGNRLGGACGLLADCGGPSSIPIAVDFETRAPVNLEEAGARAYAAHKGLEIICAVFVLPDGTVLEWTPAQPPPTAVFELVRRGVRVMAHNAHGFDRYIWRRLGWPEPQWIDTLELARLSGAPGALGEYAAAELGMQKDEAGRALTLALGRLDRHGRLPPISAPQLRTVIDYCRTDALIVRQAWETALRHAVEIEPTVRAAHTVINDRGFGFDRELGFALIDVERELASKAREVAEVTAKLLASPKQLRSALAASGVVVADARRDTLIALLDDPDLPDGARAIVSARLAASGIAGHKLNAALRLVGADGRLRDALSYCQAHTGRWAGRGFQPQNLPRGIEFGSVELFDRAVDAALRRDVAALEEIAATVGATAQQVCATLVRACIVATSGGVLGVVDYAQIEARALVWLAGDSDALHRFAAGIDPYVHMAAKLFGVDHALVTRAQRSVGKPLVLGAGYGMGAQRFEAYAAGFSVDWNGVAITPASAVEGWRSAHPKVAGYPTRLANGGVFRRDGLWQKLESAAVQAVRGTRTRVGPLVWERRGQHVVCVLPSGRPMTYRRAQLQLRPTPWGKPRLTFTYELRGQRVPTYGAKLTENVTQAVCRDILAEALVRLERAEKRVVLHVHDEFVVDLEHASELEETKRLVMEPPSWAQDLPLHADGHAGGRYRK